MTTDGTLQPSPYQVGDWVIYTPSRRGYDLDANAGPEGRLIPGRRYRVTEIQQGSYVVVEGYVHPGGGLYWTEFSPAPQRKARRDHV